MKKITILSLHLGYGGIEKSICALANLLCEDYKVEIVSVYKLLDKPAFYIDGRVKIKYLTKDIKPNKEEFNNALKNKKIFSIIKEGFNSTKILYLRHHTMTKFISTCNSDIIISTRDIFDEWLGLYGKDKVIKIGWEHNHYHGDLKYADNIVRSCKRLDYLVLVSNNLKDFYKEAMKNYDCKCVFIPNIIDNFPSRIAPLEEKRLISVGRLSKEKGFIDLLKLFKVLNSNHKDWVLDIIGDGNEKDNLEEYIKNNKLDNCVTLHGFRDKEYIDKMLNKSSLYVMTSHTESFGIVLIEAMSHGVPCVAYDSAEGAKELIISGENGYLIHNRNMDMMIKKIEDLMSNYDRRREIGKVSREFSKNYTGNVVIKEWVNLIEKGDINE